MTRSGSLFAFMAIVAFSLTTAHVEPAMFSVRRGLPLSWVSIR